MEKGNLYCKSETPSRQAIVLSALLAMTGTTVANAHKAIASPSVWAQKRANKNRANHETIVNEQRQREIIHAQRVALEIKNNDRDRGYRHGSARKESLNLNTAQVGEPDNFAEQANQALKQLDEYFASTKKSSKEKDLPQKITISQK